MDSTNKCRLDGNECRRKNYVNRNTQAHTGKIFNVLKIEGKTITCKSERVSFLPPDLGSPPQMAHLVACLFACLLTFTNRPVAQLDWMQLSSNGENPFSPFVLKDRRLKFNIFTCVSVWAWRLWRMYLGRGIGVSCWWSRYPSWWRTSVRSSWAKLG